MIKVVDVVSKLAELLNWFLFCGYFSFLWMIFLFFFYSSCKPVVDLLQDYF
jgi:hypothetical protein